MSDNRRQKERERLIHYLRIFDRDSGEPLGNLVDVSPGGLRMLVEERVELQTIWNIRMQFPEMIKGKNGLDYRVKVIWCDVSQEDDNLFSVGVETLDIPEEDLAVLVYLINLYRD